MRRKGCLKEETIGIINQLFNAGEVTHRQETEKTLNFAFCEDALSNKLDLGGELDEAKAPLTSKL